MTGEPPPNEGSTVRPPAGSWAPTYPAAPPPRSRGWRAIAVLALSIAVLAAALAVAALVLSLSGASRQSATMTAPTYSAADVASAQQQLCAAYTLAARAVQVDTNGNDVALGRIAATNAAAMLDSAAANPALDAKHRDAADALAKAYRTTTAMAAKGVATDVEWQAALDDVNAKDAAMKKACAEG